MTKMQKFWVRRLLLKEKDLITNMSDKNAPSVEESTEDNRDLTGEKVSWIFVCAYVFVFYIYVWSIFLLIESSI